MDTVSILIQTEDVELAAQLSKRPLEFDTQELQIVSCRRVTQRNEANQVIEIILQVTGNIALGIISNWIYDQLKSRVSHSTLAVT